MGLLLVLGLPVVLAMESPLLQWRRPVYIAGGFAGILALALMLPQPLLAGGYLPGLQARRGRRVHRVVGATLVAAVGLHVGALFVTSPPDMIDALTFTAPTAFSLWGVVSMWMLICAAVLAIPRRRLGLRFWRIGHTVAVVLAVTTGVIHAFLVEGTMEPASKVVLCLLVVAATAKTVFGLRAWRALQRRRE